MPYIQIAITGDGSDANPFRPNFPVNMQALGIPWTAHIPSDPLTGAPLFPDAIVWIPNRIALPGGLTGVVIASATARTTIRNREPSANFTVMERLP